MIAAEIGSAGADHVPVICGLARCNQRDIERAWEAVRVAKKPRIHTFMATSEKNMKYKLKMTPQQVLDKARSDREFLYTILGEAIRAGATTINIPDTVGYTLPTKFGQLIADIKSNTPGGAHAGARQVEVTINGIGERAENASLEEVEEYSGLRIQPHKAIVGANAFAHQSGIHQLGYDIDGNELDGLFTRFKTVARNKKGITDDDLIALVSDEIFQPQVVWKLVDVQVTCGTLSLSTATIKLANVSGDEHTACSVGTGPVDAAYKAVDLIVKV
ncbi:hypothetical protein SASPL_133676 [Salvia splendens]|uniref:2-isopropylmalate synthase n=1 Tax=Salvia splendens TaxID=180675 RepID=A0A8X8ZJC3_SALSN|nr:hypothetical protein SASPL_133676 [Salvia splendens]